MIQSPQSATLLAIVTRSKTTLASLYCLRVELEGITPAIWRRIWIEGSAPLIKLHHTIQAAMGWTDTHLHEFRIGADVYATPHREDWPERTIVDERRVQLHKALNGISSFGYVYDFGDSWEHTITVEKVAPPPELPRRHAYVEAGERACPPENAGGARGYQEFLDQFTKNRRHKEVRAFQAWAGQDFNPDQFDRHAANAALLRIAWNQWGDY